MRPLRADGESLSILVPSYNEAATLQTALRRLWAVDLPVPARVVVVDDGSRDGSADLVEALRPESPWPLVVVRHEENRGKTAALRTALQHADGTLTLVYDADLEYDPADIPTLLKPVLEGKADAVYGTRFGSPQRRVLFFWHALGNRAVTALANLFANLNLTDMETCFKLVRTDLLKAMRIRSERFGFEPEVTVKLGRMGVRVWEVPIRYAGRSYEEGKKIRWWDAVRAVGTILRAGLVESPAADPAVSARLVRERLSPYYGALLARAGLDPEGPVILPDASQGGLPPALLQSARAVLTEPDPEAAGRLATRYAHRPNIEVVTWKESGPLPADLAGAMDTAVYLHGPARGGTFPAAAALRAGGTLIALLPAGPALRGALDSGLGIERRYRRREVVDLLEGTGLALERLERVDLPGAAGWLAAGTLLRQRRLHPVHATAIRLLLPLIRLEKYLPLPGGRCWLLVARTTGATRT